MGKNIVFIALTCSLLIDCSPSSIVKKYYTDSKYKNGYGIVFCSISRLNVKPYYTRYELDFLNVEDNKKHTFSLDPPGKSSTIKPHYKNDTAEGYYRAIILPVGKYKVFNFLLYNTSPGYGGTIFKCKNEFDIPFEVFENKITYLGEYMCVPFKNKFGLLGKQPAGGIFVVSDRLIIDSEIIQNKFKEIDFNNVLNQTPNKSTINIQSDCIVIR